MQVKNYFKFWKKVRALWWYY